MATRLAKGGASALPNDRDQPMSEAFIGEVVERAPTIIRAWEDQKGEGSTLLDEPWCRHDCPLCFEECARRGIHARLWAKLWVKANTTKAATIVHNGVAYARPMGRA